MSEYVDTGHGQLAAAQEAEHDVDYQHYHHVEYDDGHGGHFEETDYTVISEHDEASDQEQTAEYDDGQPHAHFSAAHEAEHEVDYRHYHHVEYDDGHGGHVEESDFTAFSEHDEESDQQQAVGSVGHADELLGELDSQQLDAFFGPGHELSFGEEPYGTTAPGGHLGAAHDPDTWVSN